MSTLLLENWENLDNWTRCASGEAIIVNNTLVGNSALGTSVGAGGFNPIYLWNNLIDSNFVVEAYIKAGDDQSLYFFKWTDTANPSTIGFFNSITYTYFQMIFDLSGSWWNGMTDVNGNVLSGHDIIFAVRKPGFPPEMSSQDGSDVSQNFNLYRIGTYVVGSTYRVVFGKKSDGTCYGSVYNTTNGALIGTMSALCEIPDTDTLSLVLGIGRENGAYGNIKMASNISDIQVTEMVSFGEIDAPIVPPTPTVSENKRTFNDQAEYSDLYPKYPDPTSPIGLERYLDLESMTPSHIRNRSEMMEIIYLFQDYVNNVYKKIPHPFNTITYSNDRGCGIVDRKVVEVIREPYNHDISMEILRENNSIDFAEKIAIEEYDSSRDISTYIGDLDKKNDYIMKYNYEYSVGSPFYNRMKYYYSPNDLISRGLGVTTPFTTFISTVDSHLINNSDLNNQFMLSNEISSTIGSINTNHTLYVYFCNKEDFVSTVTYVGNITLESTFYPVFEGTVDNYNESSDHLTIGGVYTKAELEAILPDDIGRFRISVSRVGTINATLTQISNKIMPISIGLNFNNIEDFSNMLGQYDFPIMAPEFKVIMQWQDPETFYNEFNHENEHRIDDKKKSVLEKIGRIAFNKDPSVIDIEYIQYVAEQMGYNIGVEQEDIEDNEYYTTREEKEMALRNIIRTLPEFYKIKCTKNGLEAMLLSFGIVGEIVYLYTIGDSKNAGYVDFVDSRLIEGDYSDGMIKSQLGYELMEAQLRNPSLASTVVSDWFPSPHFKVEIDLLKQDLGMNMKKLGLGLLNKAVKKTKPINTVFQGFYGKMMANFAYIFIHKPKGHMSAYTRTSVDSSCIHLDIWDTKCDRFSPP